ncbi:hypothetical protein OEZ86_007265 [Tetradesmus obliquus]|nr:hypothetical protein OEZ86_007265 [Tetradesmus obliquus]
MDEPLIVISAAEPSLAQVLEDDPDLGVDSSTDEPQLIYACASLAVPDGTAPPSTQDPNNPATDQAGTPAAFDAITIAQAGAGTPTVVSPGSMRITAGENLNLVSPVTLDPAVTPASVWALSSRRLAPLKIWLNFRGCRVTGSAWNSAYNRTVIQTPPYSADADVNNVTPQELANIAAIWRAVYVWEAVSHEVGHTMGLLHDGRRATDGSSTAYYEGVNGWAPIMGVGYYQPLTQWSKGNTGADNLQDDVAIIAGKLRYSWSGNGNTTTNAINLRPTVLSNGVANVSALGIVQQPGALDMFKVTAGAGLLSFSVAGVNAFGGDQRSNLKVAVRVLNAAGAEIASSQNTAGLGVTGTAFLPIAGDCFIEVRGASLNDALTTGSAAYGSLGQFQLSATFTASTRRIG